MKCVIPSFALGAQINPPCLKKSIKKGGGLICAPRKLTLLMI